QILTTQLQRNIQEEAEKVSEQDIDDYYKKNPEAYQQYSLERLYIPRTKQAEEVEANEKKDSEKETEQQEKAKQEQDEQEMSKLAESLRARAAAGEDFAKLQKEAFAAAAGKAEPPAVSMPKVRRTGLPQSHAPVFDLKPGEVSVAYSDAGGYSVYKMVSKEPVPLDQAKEEIRGTVRTQRVR